MKIELYPLTELLEFIVDNRGKTVPTEEHGIVLIATNCIKNNELFPVFEKVRYLSRSTYENWFRAHPIPGDIIFVNKGTPGRVCLVPEPVNFCIAQDMVAFRANPSKIYNKYLFAALRSESIQVQIGNMHVGTLIPHVKKSHLDKLLIPVPDIVSQRAIGDFYYDISYKIELNNRIIANLEAQAQAIFKSWFVDFEPFQDGEFEESELGLIPKGWRVGTLRDICHYSNERVAVDTLNNQTYISTENMLPNKQGFVEATSLPTTAYTTAYHSGNVLISNIRPYFKKIVYCYGEGGCSTDVICFDANDGIPSEYLFHLLYNDNFFDFMVGGSKGTKMPRGDKQQLMQYPVVQPDDKWLAGFKKVTQPMLLQSYTLKQENERLAQTRDTLLPKLMSGEIEVPVEG